MDILSGFNHTRHVRSKRYLLAASRFLVEYLHDSGFHLIEISFVVIVFLSRTYLSTEGLEPTLFSRFSPTLFNPGNDVGLEWARSHQRGADSFGIHSSAGYLDCRGFVSKKICDTNFCVLNTFISLRFLFDSVSRKRTC